MTRLTLTRHDAGRVLEAEEARPLLNYGKRYLTQDGPDVHVQSNIAGQWELVAMPAGYVVRFYDSLLY